MSFNFYNQPALFLNPLKSQLKEVRDSQISISRFSNADLLCEENALSLEYFYIIEDKKANDNILKIRVNEKMRYFTKLELDYYLEKAGFTQRKYYNYMTMDELSCGVWNGCVVARKQ